MTRRMRRTTKKFEIGVYSKALLILAVLAFVVGGALYMLPSDANFYNIGSAAGNFYVSASDLDKIQPVVVPHEVVLSRTQKISSSELFVAIPGTYPGQSVAYKLDTAPGTWQEGVISVYNGETGVIVGYAKGVHSVTIAFTIPGDDSMRSEVYVDAWDW